MSGYKIKILLMIFFLLLLGITGKTYCWEKTYGGSDQDIIHSVQQTNDNGYIAAGSTKSFGNSNEDIYLLKTDANGNEMWSKAFGNGSDTAFGEYVQQTNDNGYIITGRTRPNIYSNDWDVILIKTDSEGNEKWVKTYGGAGSQYGKSVRQTNDGGYIIIGYYTTNNGNDVYLIKTDSNGNEIWSKTFNNQYNDYGNSGQQTIDSGYIVLGYTSPYNPGTYNGYDFYLLKTNASGNKVWSKTYNLTKYDIGEDVQQTSDGGYVIFGNTGSDGAGSDIYVIKTNQNGDVLWTKTIGGIGNQKCQSGQQTSDGGYIIAGYNDASGNINIYLVKLDNIGNILWTKTFGTSSSAYGWSVQQTKDGGYIIGGYTSIYGSNDAYLIKTDKDGISEKIESIPIANAGDDITVSKRYAVALNGSGSYDPDNNLPLNFFWQIVSKPNLSVAFLSNPNIINPTFTPDVPGNYIVELIVINSKGGQSVPDQININYFNTPPIAIAGDDLFILKPKTTIELDGAKSYDLDDDSITFQWTLLKKPEHSEAVLTNTTTANPVFTADVYGEYIFELIVSDTWSQSKPDTTIVNLINIKPLANGGLDQIVVQNTNVYLDGSKSNDPNSDTITFKWSIMSKPVDSLSELNDSNAVKAAFIPDKAGEYKIQLIVSDTYLDSDPVIVNITVITLQKAAIQNVNEAKDIIKNFDINVFKNKNNQKTLDNKLNEVLNLINEEYYEQAHNKLNNDILSKTDGFVEQGVIDKNDWIQGSLEQKLLYPKIQQAVDYLNKLFNN